MLMTELGVRFTDSLSILVLILSAIFCPKSYHSLKCKISSVFHFSQIGEVCYRSSSRKDVLCF